MAGEWKTVKLGDVLTLQRGFDLPSQKRNPGKVPIVSSSGISDYHSEVGVKGPGVITGRYGTIGQVFLIKEDYWPLNTTLWVKDFHGNDPQFTSYLLRTVDFRSCSDKSSVPGVNRNDLHRIPVLLPPLPEQKRIAHILGTLDDKIELNRRMNKTLEEMARALFKSWFIDFDPVVAKCEGRQPEGMDAATDKLFPLSFENSELGRIPKGWKVGTLSDVAIITMGQSPQGETFNEDGNGIVFYQGRAEFGWRYPTRRLFTTDPKRMAQASDILMSVRAPVGDINVANEACCIGRGLSAIRSKNGQASFMLYAMESLKEQLDVYDGEGTVFGCINKDALGGLKILVPSETAISAFENKARQLDKMIFTNSMQSRTLAALRDVLLPKLMNGASTGKE